MDSAEVPHDDTPWIYSHLMDSDMKEGLTAPAHDAAWYEREYGWGLENANTSALLASWSARAEVTRSENECILDIPTGNHPREALDLFRARDAKGTVLFIHGGFWRTSSKNDMAWIADGFLHIGYSVVFLNYPLCPEASLREVSESVQASFARLVTEILSDAESGAIVIVGHSAGAYLATSLMATVWNQHGLETSPIRGVVAISGLFELEPLLHTSHNRSLRLDKQLALQLSLTSFSPAVDASLILVVGELETAELHRQSHIMAHAWSTLRPRIVSIKGEDHYGIVEGLARTGSELHRIVLTSMAATPGV
ncbi:hypothetical protein bAD24_p01520 (plasmid) [Burkholderia sp. AD24]|nr:hypothetical protein bAD24_p01520 [Burkholderia sp. AD24]